MATTRKQKKRLVAVLEGSTIAGAALGLFVRASTATPSTQAKPCDSHAAAACAGHSFAAALKPYLVSATVGAVIGLALATALIFAWRSRGTGPAIPTTRRQAIPERVRHEVWRRDEACCVDCGSRARLEFDHIIPVSRGGSNTVRNIELRCEGCNRSKGARI
jgi:hypothetical protein